MISSDHWEGLCIFSGNELDLLGQGVVSNSTTFFLPLYDTNNINTATAFALYILCAL